LKGARWSRGDSNGVMRSRGERASVRAAKRSSEARMNRDAKPAPILSFRKSVRRRDSD